MNELKKSLRKKYIEQRNNIDSEIRNKIDEKIINYIISSEEYISAKNIFTFVGIGSEINTKALIEKALEEGKNVYVPLCISKSKMEAKKITNLDELKENRLGLLEPSDDSENINIEKIDLSIIPCLSVDKEGYRLGYGGGFYDRFFSHKTWKDAFVICREDFISDQLPHDDFDVKFNIIVSESGVYNIKRLM